MNDGNPALIPVPPPASINVFTVWVSIPPRITISDTITIPARAWGIFFVILGKRILILDEALAPAVKRDIIAGKVIEIDESQVTIQKNGDTANLGVGKKTKLKINGIKKPTVEDIQVNDYLTAIVAIGEKDEPGDVKAVLVIPGKTNPQAEENEVTEGEIESATPAAEEDQE